MIDNFFLSKAEFIIRVEDAVRACGHFHQPFQSLWHKALFFLFYHTSLIQKLCKQCVWNDMNLRIYHKTFILDSNLVLFISPFHPLGELMKTLNENLSVFSCINENYWWHKRGGGPLPRNFSFVIEFMFKGNINYFAYGKHKQTAPFVAMSDF